MPSRSRSYSLRNICKRVFKKPICGVARCRPLPAAYNCVRLSRALAGALHLDFLPTLSRVFPLIFFTLLFISTRLLAYPSDEKAALSLVSSQATSMVMNGDRYLFVSFGSQILRIDTETFALTSAQVPALTNNSSSGGANLTGDVQGLAIRDSSLFVTQSDGDLLTINLNSITSEPTTTNLITGSLGPLVADTETGTDDDKLYILDKTNNAVIVYDIGAGTKSSISLVDSLGAAVTPVSLLFVPFPTNTSTGTTDKIFVTSNRGLVFVINEGGTGLASTITLSQNNKDLPALAITPGGEFVLVVNSSDTTVSVIDTATNSEVDTDSATGGTNPIALLKNGSLKNIAITDVANPVDTYAFVTGSSGVSVIDLNISTISGFGVPTILDLNDQGSSDTDDNPLALTSSPGWIIASSEDDETLYTSNSNATISVITEKPFVTIASTSLGSSALTTSGSFTVTFQSDEAGTYRVLAGGTLSATGTELTTGSVTASTDTTSSSISFSASTFTEGTNRIFVFVTDSDGNVGRDAIDITVDTPPSAVTIDSTGFGNGKVSVTFDRLTVSDMDHYNVYVDTDGTTVTTKTEVAATVSQPSSGSRLTADVSSLTNGTTYFIAVEGVDATGNVGTRVSTLSSGAAASATPERTVGLAESLGETGCSLTQKDSRAPVLSILHVILWILLPLMILGVLRSPIVWSRLFPLFVLIFLGMFPRIGEAKELTPQWWSLELKGGIWLPTASTTKNFLGSCCDPSGKMEFGFLYQSKFGFEVGVGYIGSGGRSVGTTSGQVSSDRFDFTMIPLENSLTFRADFMEDQLLVPYVKAGPDYVIFRENSQGSVTKGVKYGLHTAIGLQILMDRIEDLSDTMEQSLGVNDVYLTLESRYGWINNFGGGGVNLSHLMFTGGFLFEF